MEEIEMEKVLDHGLTPTSFEVSIQARWPDMDQNGHMRTVAYLEVAEDSRMQYFASSGYSVVSRDGLQYRAELRLLKPR